MALALAIAFQSCSSSGLVVREYEYDPQSAEAYYYGENEYEAGRYGLVFIAGRTDEDANLVSHGATLVLMLKLLSRISIRCRPEPIVQAICQAPILLTMERLRIRTLLRDRM